MKRKRKNILSENVRRCAEAAPEEWPAPMARLEMERALASEQHEQGALPPRPAAPSDAAAGCSRRSSGGSTQIACGAAARAVLAQQETREMAREALEQLLLDATEAAPGAPETVHARSRRRGSTWRRAAWGIWATRGALTPRTPWPWWSR